MSRRLFGAALLVVAGIAAVVGTFLPLFWQDSAFGGVSPRFTTTSWRLVVDNMPEGLDAGLPSSPQYGVPVVVSAVLLGVAAALVFLPEAQRPAGRYLAVAATGLLAGAVWSTWSVVAAALGDNVAPGMSYTAEAGEGIVVLVASVVVAIVGVVLLHDRRSKPSPEGPVVYRVDDAGDDDMDTPPFGIPVPEVEIAVIPESEYDRRSEGPGSGQ